MHVIKMFFKILRKERKKIRHQREQQALEVFVSQCVLQRNVSDRNRG